MAGFIAMAAALARVRTIKCPHCGATKAVERTARAYRTCPRCKKHFPDPAAPKAKQK